ncbi:MAG: hypothetical protein WEE64_02535 [Dehalococcoidia bacterium]
MDLYDLEPGDLVRVGEAGAVAEVVRATEDGRSILVRYVESPEDRHLVGTERLCAEDEVVEKVALN